ncbi:Pseudouridine synthase, RsuA/RluB/C/D/E/F domain and Pseudouridine synthase, catalytic domain-containing protein [Strongyloides ratti]|uniref:Pseudouridylate synthase RPUSD4, mitochondrial n=1 Tax=Strongyloides ratti TaxID=34506 RepID=A0A090LEE2_STRRB|nr:Pseudouridine synthase, RsuA/RluB/C/D/E/F domain and Pseudouridine synthase, catalytic domain-containing protein [Strongyloides ratti]CEF65880.2 Pseudouridine synthase, RsuA/RluB/C/D/E/F domain and Pseudouridine synthase, catalytic domain-containing protein [Strongyloides ratti]
MTKDTKLDDVFGITYQTETWTKDNDSVKKSEQKENDLKDDVFTEQILNSSPSTKIDSCNVEKNNDKDESVDEDFFTTNFFSKYNNIKKSLSHSSSYNSQEKQVNNLKDDKYMLKNVISQPIFVQTGDYGIQMIRNMIDTCWKYNKVELANYMEKRVIYNDNSLIAFDKPILLSYSGSYSDNSINMDSCLQELKKLVAPNIPRLNLVKSLDKQYSGITLFAKSSDEQKRYKEMIENNLIKFTYRLLVRGIPPYNDGVINFPLVKLLRNKNDIIVKPCIQEKLPKNNSKGVMFATTNYRIIEKNKLANMAYLEVETQTDFPHQIRAHLSYGLNTPLVGDFKYNPLNRSNVQTPPKFTNEANNLLDITSQNGYKKVPMLCHLKALTFPGMQKSSNKSLSISCPMPQHMKYILKKLRLLKK